MRLDHAAWMGYILLSLLGCKENKPAPTPQETAPQGMPADSALEEPEADGEDEDEGITLYLRDSYSDPGGVDGYISDLSCREKLKELMPPVNDSTPGKYRSFASEDTLLRDAGCTEFLPSLNHFVLYRNPGAGTVSWKPIDPLLKLSVSADEVPCDPERVVGVHLMVHPHDTLGAPPLLFASLRDSLASTPLPWAEWEWHPDLEPDFDSTQLPRMVKRILPGLDILGLKEVWTETHYAWDGGSEQGSRMKVRERQVLKASTQDGKEITLYTAESEKGYSYAEADIPLVQVTDLEGDGKAEIMFYDASEGYHVLFIEAGKVSRMLTLRRGHSRMVSGC